jgi:hypothetical protein
MAGPTLLPYLQAVTSQETTVRRSFLCLLGEIWNKIFSHLYRRLDQNQREEWKVIIQELCGLEIDSLHCRDLLSLMWTNRRGYLIDAIVMMNNADTPEYLELYAETASFLYAPANAFISGQSGYHKYATEWNGNPYKPLFVMHLIIPPAETAIALVPGDHPLAKPPVLHLQLSDIT